MPDRNVDLSVDGKKTLSYALAAIILGGVFSYGMWRFGGTHVSSVEGITPTSLQRFSSYEELKEYLARSPETRYPRHDQIPTTIFVPPPSLPKFQQNLSILLNDTKDILILYGVPNFSYAMSTTPNWDTEVVLVNQDSGKYLLNAIVPGSSDAIRDFSQTNIQVEGVDEADLVKTDGEFIYFSSEQAVLIVRAFPPDAAEIVSRLELNEEVCDIFISGDKLVVFHTSNGADQSTTIKVFDISDRSEPSLDRTISVDGYYFNSRMIDDHVYAIIRERAYLDHNEEVALPIIRTDGGAEEIEASMIYHPNSTDDEHAFTNVIAVNVQDPEEPPSHETYLLGSACSIYVSLDHIYIASPRWMEDNGEYTEGTTVHEVRIDEGEITYMTDGSVPGHVLNQFSMDEYDGNLRIATTIGRVSRISSDTVSNVYVLGPEMNVVGSVEGLAPGEEIYSARFMGSRCYLVTFKKVDPLFVIDLGDPNNPKVLGKLKIPGYSDYLHPYDATHLIGIGKETIEAEEGDFAWYQGVKISLFDVSNVSNPREMAKYEIGDRGTDSLALRDHKAFLFDRDRNLLVMPVLEAKIDRDSYSEEVPPHARGEFVYQGAYVFNISLSEGIVLRGRVTHLDDQWDLVRSGYVFESRLSVQRALYIDDVLYTLSRSMIKMSDLASLDELNNLELP